MLFKKICLDCVDIILICLTLFIGAGAQFRSDYTYSKHTNAYYKFHIESASNARASDVCEAEGSKLMVVTSPRDLDVAHGMLKVYPDLDGKAWIATDGKEHPDEDEDYSDYDSVEPLLTLVSQGRIMSGTKCNVLTRDGEVRTAHCITRHPFVCKTDASDVQYDPYCKIYVKGYRYFDAQKSCYKVPKYAASWNEAYSYCQAEGGHLVVVNSVAEQQVVRNLTKVARAVGSEVPWFYFVGVRAQKPKEGGTPDFRTILNQTLPEAGFNTWCTGEPNNSDGNQYCGTILTFDGKFNDEDCTKTLGFVCEKEL
ncbi:secretory phospholipase A2 receptor-like [Aricia agestis]|uniref:secretory phospholipase A2 receptor-like n=1 Tax=Aricia agestis TaxID=91739 RepID=UPI001C203716|nr:secretory phospholipase A2 receptor-like [Aricia agestis]